MPASTDANRDTSKEAVLARLEQYESTPAHQKEKITDLPRWVKTALVMKEVDGLTYKEAAARFKKAASTLANYGKSPAAKEWISHLAEFVDDPLAMAKAYMSANALSVTLDRLAFLQAAIDAGDYATGDKIAKDLQDRMGIVAKQNKHENPTIILNLASGALEIPAGDYDSEIQEGDFDVEEG